MKIIRFEIEGHFFIYDPHTNLLLKCHRLFAEAAELLSKGEAEPGRVADIEAQLTRRLGLASASHVRQVVRLWYFLGAFQAETLNVTGFPTKTDLVDEHSKVCSLSSLTLCVTDDCNLRCAYCSYSGNYEFAKTHSSRHMASETALNALDYFIAHSVKSRSVNYSFYGGEPLLVWPTVEKCINHIRQCELALERNFTITMTTNGTLLTRNIAAQLVEANVYLTVSLDGPRSIHNRHRRTRGNKGTFDRVTANLVRLRKSHPDYYRHNVSFSTVFREPEHIPEVNLFFAQGLGRDHPADHFQVSFVATQNAKQEFAASLGNQVQDAFLTRLTDEYVKAASIDRLNEWKLIDAFYNGKMNNKILRRRLSLLRQPFRPGNQCVVGIHNIFVAADGSFYPCSALEQPAYRLGDAATGLDLDRVVVMLKNYEDLMLAGCRSCWAARQCRLCMANVLGGQYSSDLALDNLCSAQKESLIDMMKIYCRILLQKGDSFECRPCGEHWIFPDVIEAERVEEGLGRFGLSFQDEG